VLDLFYLAIAVIGFVVLWGITVACDRAWGGVVMVDYIVSGIVSLLVLIYFGWAMFQPEKF
jgi:hypothetical protein